MVTYKCPRCLYTSDRKSSIQNHIHKKKICKLVNLDIDIKMFENEILNGNEEIEKMQKKNDNPVIKEESIGIKIPLKNKKGDVVAETIVDEDVYLKIKDIKWCMAHGYAQGHVDKIGVKLHRFIMNATKEDPFVDHINNNRLDNRRCNLRFVTAAQNSQNRIKKEDTSSKYIGVNRTKNGWQCQISFNKNIKTNKFKIEKHAAYWYDQLALKHYGPNAKINGIVKPTDFIEPPEIKRTKRIKNEVEFEEIKIEDILRNEDNIAIIGLYNSEKELVGEALVDDYEYNKLIRYKWHISPHNYATTGLNGTKTTMHRILMNAKEGDMIDHINNNRLDNRKENLRFTTNSFNVHNVSKQKDTTSKYIGVHFNTIKNKYVSVVIKDNISYFCGDYRTEVGAAKARDLKALELYSDHAKLNFKELENEYKNKLKSKIHTKIRLFDTLCPYASRKTSESTSKYIGVNFDKSRNKYAARFTFNDKQINCGRFNTQEEAAKSRYVKSIKMYASL